MGQVRVREAAARCLMEIHSGKAFVSAAVDRWIEGALKDADARDKALFTLGAAALPMEPSASVTSASTVGLPLESMISLPMTCMICK